MAAEADVSFSAARAIRSESRGEPRSIEGKMNGPRLPFGGASRGLVRLDCNDVASLTMSAAISGYRPTALSG